MRLPELRQFALIALHDARRGGKFENVDLVVQPEKKDIERVSTLVLNHVDDRSAESWTDEGNGDEMRADFERCVTEM